LTVIVRGMFEIGYNATETETGLGFGVSPKEGKNLKGTMMQGGERGSVVRDVGGSCRREDWGREPGPR